MASTPIIEIGFLPPHIQAVVQEHLQLQRYFFANQGCCYFASNGCASAEEYRQRLLTEYVPDVCEVQLAIQSVLVGLYKRNAHSIEGWMRPILTAHPKLLEHSAL